jgi:hypothetical protein
VHLPVTFLWLEAARNHHLPQHIFKQHHLLKKPRTPKVTLHIMKCHREANYCNTSSSAERAMEGKHGCRAWGRAQTVQQMVLQYGQTYGCPYLQYDCTTTTLDCLGNVQKLCLPSCQSVQTPMCSPKPFKHQKSLGVVKCQK